MKRIIFFLAGVLCFVAVNLLLTGYGNKLVHPAMNGVMVEKFESNFITAAFPLEKFKNYTIVFDGSTGFPGIEVMSGGFVDIVERETRKNALQWIVHGGYSADEPELSASFRHFYDPIEPAGNRYLHNHLDQTGELNPRIDHIEWALSNPDHLYNWEYGLAEMEYALTNYDEEVKEASMAKAYRALGETLHMIADMGCPAHVRDDSHAAEPFTGYKFGSPDPYEEFFEDFSEIKNYFSDGMVDPALKSAFREASTVHSIATMLAQYTNANFFTHQTISGKSVVPLIHPEKTYPSPKLEDCSYDELTYTYTKNISGNEVKMCKDLRYRFQIFSNRGYPYIDKECVLSQGKALVPQIVEAGANVIRLFIPALEVRIDDFDEELKTISGTVLHKKCVEYPRVIKYMGKVSIYNVKNNKKIAEVNCLNGKFEEEIRLNDFKNVDWENKGIYALIELGGINVKSDPYTKNVTFDVKRIDIDIMVTGNISTTGFEGEQETSVNSESIYAEPMTNISQSGNSITATIDSVYSILDGNYHRKAWINLTLKGTNLELFEIIDSLTMDELRYYHMYVTHFISKGNPYKPEQCYYYSPHESYIYYGLSHEIADFFSFQSRVTDKDSQKQSTRTMTSILPNDNATCTIEIYQ